MVKKAVSKNVRAVKRSKEAEAQPDSYDMEPHFAVLDLYHGQNKQMLTAHHMNSFHQFIEEIIPQVLQSGPNIIFERATETVIMRQRLEFTDLDINPPATEDDEPITPLEAIQKNVSYMAKYTATITQKQDVINISTGDVKTTVIGTEKGTPIAKIPIMVGSKYCTLSLDRKKATRHCRYDPGGYFIISGGEKAILTIETAILRKPIVTTQKEQNWVTYSAKIQSRHSSTPIGTPKNIFIKIRKDETIVLTAPRFKEVSIFTMMRALGVETDQDIVSCVASPKEKDIIGFLTAALNNQTNPVSTREEAIIALSSGISSRTYTDADPALKLEQKKIHLMKILSEEFLPHVATGTGNPESDMLCKGYYLGYALHKLIKCYIRRDTETDENKGCDDRDSMINKRYVVSGTLLASQFEQQFKKILSECHKSFRTTFGDENRKATSIINRIKPNTIEQGLRQALSTGTFTGPNLKGLSQALNRLNNLHTRSFMRRITTPSINPATNKAAGPRHLHNTRWGSIDPLESPTGQNIGLDMNMAMTTQITINQPVQENTIQDYLSGKYTNLHAVAPSKLHSHVKIFINGNWIGVTDKITQIHHDLRDMRFRGEIERTVSLVMLFREREFHIYTEDGRMVRPFFTVTNNELNFKPEMLEGINTWNELLAKYPYIIEFLDKEEEQNMMLAVYPQDIESAKKIMDGNAPTNRKEIDKINHTNRYDGHVFVKYTHCEIHPCMILGLISSNIPYLEHNQAVRGIYQYNQARQAMGLYSSDFLERTDISYILFHTQIPIVASRASKYTGTNIFPSGENCIAAIMSQNGYNQEDSIVANNSAFQKGLFRAQSLKKVYEQIKKNQTSAQTGQFMKPNREDVDGMRNANYETLTEAGYADVETQIMEDDAIIGMVTPIPQKKDADAGNNKRRQKPYRDSSIIHSSVVPATVDRVFTGYNNDSYPMIKIRLRSLRNPQNGDKFSSRHGQKGTVGIRNHRVDMPFTPYGLVPDLIANENAFPKRMTIGQLAECLVMKVCAIKGIYGDATPFAGADLDKANQDLIDEGWEDWGRDTMYCGITGRKMTTRIFIGPTYYQRLKQMSADKVHSRARGTSNLLTRQPPEGKARNGGLRIGEMERDAIIAHGAIQYLKEKTVENSDIYNAYVCDICGQLAHKAGKMRYYICRGCNNTTKISPIIIPYACKLFFQELQTINILPRIRTDARG
jgi:DNA-directed RNA polymerase II subunit RPB2